jgi:hypothetical protein
VLKRRHIYVLLFAVPALLVSLIAAAMVLAATAGALWLFVFGDNPWPPVADTLLGAVLFLAGVGVWLGLLFVAYTVGKQEELRSTLNMRHVALSVGATIVLIAVIVARVAGVQIFGTESDSLICSDLCRAQGFPASGTPPRDSGDRTCSCYDDQGREARRVPLPGAASSNP